MRHLLGESGPTRVLPMYPSDFSRLKAVPCALVVASLAAGCGGGSGGGGYGSGMSQTPAPTVMFSSPAQATTIHLGQAVKLAWSTTNATSCSASTSSDIGGSFS